MLLRHKLLISATTVAAACVAGVFAAFRPDVYEASVLIVPESQPVRGRGVLMQEAASEFFPGVPLPSKAEDVCLDLLHSNRLLDAVIERLPELRRMWGQTYREEMRERLLSLCRFEQTSSGLLRITARVTDRQLSARLGNALAEELQRLYGEIMIERIHKDCEFLKKRLAEAAEELAAAEERLAEFQRAKKIIRPEESATATFSMLMSLESRIIEEDTKLEVLKSYAALSNPELRLQEERVRALKKSLGEIEQDGNPSDNHQALIPLQQLPAVGLEGVRIEREVRLREKLYLFLMERHESLNLAEAKEGAALTVIDRAEPPEGKSGPRRLAWVAAAALAGLVLGSSCALVAERVRALGRTEEGRDALDEFKRSVWRGV